MKIAPAEAERFVREPGQELVAVLVYGPDKSARCRSPAGGVSCA